MSFRTVAARGGAMKGFDPAYVDPPDFVLQTTRAVWGGRHIDSLRDHHAPDVVLDSGGTVIRGVDGLVTATLATLAEFPDLTPLGEDVIWCGLPEDGFLMAHRSLCTGTHSGSGAHGAASGRHLVFRVMDEARARENRIGAAWRIRDGGAIARQLGLDPPDLARAILADRGAMPASRTPPTPPAPDPVAGNDNAWGARLADLVARIMAADMAAIPAVYDHAAHLSYPGGVTGHGHAAADRFWMGLRAAFPSARFDVQTRIGRDDPYMPPRAAIRWSLTGLHDGWGHFGRPTGAPVHVSGMTHAEFGRVGSGPVLLRREWTLFDETSVWAQILQHAGAA